MRPSLLLTLAILLACAAPTALASPSALHVELPEGRLASDATVPVNVTLIISDFMCSEPRDFTVQLSVLSSEGVKATFAKTNLTFSTTAHTYFAEQYRQTQTVNLTVRALNEGQLELTAVFPEHEVGPCLAPDGFQSSATVVAASVDGPPAPATPPSDPAANETETNATTTPSPTPRTPTAGVPRGPTCSPDGGCGLIGEYKAPAESAEQDVPGLGLLAAVAAITLTAIVLRRRKA